MKNIIHRAKFILVGFALVCELTVVVMALLVHQPSTLERALAEFDSILFGSTLGLISIMYFTRNLNR